MPSSVTSPLSTRSSGTQLILNINQFPADPGKILLTFTRPSWPGVAADNVISALIKFNVGGEVTAEFSGGSGSPPTCGEAVPKEGIVNEGGQSIPTPKAVQTAQAVIDFNETLDSAITFEVL